MTEEEACTLTTRPRPPRRLSLTSSRLDSGGGAGITALTCENGLLKATGRDLAGCPSRPDWQGCEVPSRVRTSPGRPPQARSGAVGRSACLGRGKAGGSAGLGADATRVGYGGVDEDMITRPEGALVMALFAVTLPCHPGVSNLYSSAGAADTGASTTATHPRNE